MDPRSGESKKPCGASGGRVLVIEDDVDSAQTLAMLLERWGYATRIAYDGETALGSLEDFDAGLVLLDLGLPSMDGYEVARQIRKNPKTSGLPIICISAHGFPEHRQRALESGCNMHLTKPVDFESLKTMIAEYVSAQRPAAA